MTTILSYPEMLAMSHHPEPTKNLVARIGQVTVRYYPCGGTPYRVFGPYQRNEFHSLDAALAYATNIAEHNAPAQLYRGDWI